MVILKNIPAIFLWWRYWLPVSALYRCKNYRQNGDHTVLLFIIFFVIFLSFLLIIAILSGFLVGIIPIWYNLLIIIMIYGQQYIYIKYCGNFYYDALFFGQHKINTMMLPPYTEIFNHCKQCHNFLPWVFWSKCLKEDN